MQNMKIRESYVAGKFYPAKKNAIIDQLDSINMLERNNILTEYSEKSIIGGVVPHAGYMFSAYQATHFFEIIKNSKEQFDTVFIVNPNHTGYEPEIALDENDFWETPLGIVEIDQDFQEDLKLPKSANAHKYEHSGEVMLPFLQHYLNYQFKILPITISNQNPENAKKLAGLIYESNKKFGKKILIIASSDFSHFVEPEYGKQIDSLVIDEILKFNSEKVYQTIRKHNISICGYGPIMTLIEYSKLLLENPKNKILKIGHSGEITPSTEVVDYVSILFYR
jgi:MEMO1 family protein